MRLLGALTIRRAIADDGAAGDQRGLCALTLLRNRLRNCFGIMPVDTAHRPAGGGEARELVVGGRERGRAVNGYAVVVEQHDQARKLEMASERDRLLADAFHQTAVADDHISEMIDKAFAVPRIAHSLGECHADRGRNPLAQRTGRRLDARRVAIFRMARRLGAPLPERLDVVEADVAAGKMEQCIEQHRAMARRQHEAIAVRPIGVSRVEFQESREQHGRDIGHAHGQAGMAGLRGLDGVDRKEANRVGEIVVRDRREVGFGVDGDVHRILPLFTSGFACAR
ncbi:hypothetical protein ACVWWR_005468 [Bradyrhizobium sp. LM3.2]